MQVNWKWTTSIKKKDLEGGNMIEIVLFWIGAIMAFGGLLALIISNLNDDFWDLESKFFTYLLLLGATIAIVIMPKAYPMGFATSSFPEGEHKIVSFGETKGKFIIITIEKGGKPIMREVPKKFVELENFGGKTASVIEGDGYKKVVIK